MKLKHLGQQQTVRRIDSEDLNKSSNLFKQEQRITIKTQPNVVHGSDLCGIF